MNVETGEGLVNADSYLSVAAADAMNTIQQDGAWDCADTVAKEAALIKATALIDTWAQPHGNRSNPNQALNWPQNGVVCPPRSRPGYPYIWPATEIPGAVQTSVFSIACKIIAGVDLEAELDIPSGGVSISGVSTQLEKKDNPLPVSVLTTLMRWGCIPRPGVARVNRV